MAIVMTVSLGDQAGIVTWTNISVLGHYLHMVNLVQLLVSMYPS